MLVDVIGGSIGPAQEALAGRKLLRSSWRAAPPLRSSRLVKSLPSILDI